MSIDKVFQSNFKLFESAFKIIALIFNFSGFKTALFSLFFEILKSFFSQIIEILFVDALRTECKS